MMTMTPHRRRYVESATVWLTVQYDTAEDELTKMEECIDVPTQSASVTRECINV